MRDGIYLRPGAIVWYDGTREGNDTYVILPYDHAPMDVLAVARSLQDWGLEMLQPDEAEPELHPKGLKVACVRSHGPEFYERVWQTYVDAQGGLAH